MRSHMISGILPLLALIGCAPTPSEEGLDPQRVTVKIDREVSVVEPSRETGLAHEMLGMVRHPDGTIFVSTETQGTDAALGLFKSTDVGETWEALRVNLADVRGKQYLRGLGGTRDGRLWLLHQTASADLFVSSSSDGAHTWRTTPVEFTNLAPRAPKEPYVHSHNDYNTFIEQPDGTLMFSVGLRYDRGYYKDPEHLMENLMRPDVDGGGEFMFRSTDGGKTWGDATLVHPHVTEVGHALGPNNPDRILSMTRTQRTLLAGEDREATIKKTGCPPDTPSDEPVIYKNGLLLESTDGGRTFHEAPGGLTDYLGHRATILWTSNNLVVVSSAAGNREDKRVMRISLDGGKTWVDGTKAGTPLLNQSTKFVFQTAPPTVSFTAPMIELSPNHFLTVYAYWEDESLKRYYQAPKNPCLQGDEPGDCPWLGIRALFWHLENLPERSVSLSDDGFSGSTRGS